MVEGKTRATPGLPTDNSGAAHPRTALGDQVKKFILMLLLVCGVASAQEQMKVERREQPLEAERKALDAITKEMEELQHQVDKIVAEGSNLRRLAPSEKMFWDSKGRVFVVVVPVTSAAVTTTSR